MPEHARRFTPAPYDQFEDGDRVADWGADELFTRMPRPRAVDDAPAPRFNRSAGVSAPDESAPPMATRAPLTAAAPLTTDAAALAPDPAPLTTDPAALTPDPPLTAAAPLAPMQASLITEPPPAPTPAPPRALVLVEALKDRREAPLVEQRHGPRERRRSGQPAAEAMQERAERLGLSVVDPAPVSAYRWDETGALIEPEPAGRRTRVITGHPDGVPRPLPIMRSERRRPARTPAEWIGARPERIVGWAFALGLILILIAISTADAAAL